MEEHHWQQYIYNITKSNPKEFTQLLFNPENFNLIELSFKKTLINDDQLEEYLKKDGYRTKSLNLSNCTGITDKALQYIAIYCQRNLKELDLSKCDIITPSGLKHLSKFCKNLKHININDCDLDNISGANSNDFLKIMPKFQNLESFYFNNHLYIRESEPNYFFKKRSCCTIL